ncbi:MAG: ABC-F family ATP-binding cassette domain-containing protein [Bacilli bacterium]|nr:ABC-F family ATP-binding cassette domain-containing protein [Bacilli bacterium]
MKYSIRNGSVTLSGNTILEEVDFEVNSREHIAIVGPNGAGKTTLLNAIINPELFDEGIGDEKFNITKIGEFNIGFLKQIEFKDDRELLIDIVREPFKELINMEKKIQNLVEEMNTNNSNELIKKYTDTIENFKLLGGYSYKKEYEVMLNKFGFTEADKEKAISSFSGGEKTKIAFIKLLLSKPDLLILDEPTNHLDIKTIEWLEEYLANYKGAIIIVSHDRMFINNIASIIYDIDYGRVIKYNGNYSFFEKTKKANYEKLLHDYEAQQREIKRLTSIYERFRNKPTKASMALSKLHQVEKMELIDKPNKIDMKTFKTNLDSIEQSVKRVLVAKDLVIGYDKPLAKLNFEIMRGKKIGIIGANGTGKSTLLKTLHGVITPLDGELSYGLKVLPGYFDQSLEFITDSCVLTEMREYNKELTELQARSALGSFLFKGEDVYKDLSILSGGEKVRLQLCKILYNKPNFLILDEPTNHMDIASKEHLEDILTEYKGTIIFVSHDRYFVEKIADELIVFEESGASYYPFGYGEYLEKIRKKQPIVETKKVKKMIEKAKIVEDKREKKVSREKELQIIENNIIKHESRIASLNQELFSSDVINDFAKINSIQSKIDLLNQELAELNDNWEKLTDEILTEKNQD